MYLCIIQYTWYYIDTLKSLKYNIYRLLPQARSTGRLCQRLQRFMRRMLEWVQRSPKWRPMWNLPKTCSHASSEWVTTPSSSWQWRNTPFTDPLVTTWPHTLHLPADAEHPRSWKNSWPWHMDWAWWSSWTWSMLIALPIPWMVLLWWMGRTIVTHMVVQRDTMLSGIPNSFTIQNTKCSDSSSQTSGIGWRNFALMVFALMAWLPCCTTHMVSAKVSPEITMTILEVMRILKAKST